MNKQSFTLLLLLIYLFSFSQTTSRIKIVSVLPSENTGQDYSSWLNDDLNVLVPNVWYSYNMKYTDIVLKLEKQSTLSKLSFYDFEGIFHDNPASFYALVGTQKIYLGSFYGEKYKEWVDLQITNSVTTDAIVVHKYGNNIPQKIFVYGQSSGSGLPPVQQQVQSVINFSPLPSKTVGDPPFQLTASSNNTQTPVTFSSSNPSVVTVSNSNGNWLATVMAPGTSYITASQAGNTNFLAAKNVVQQIIVQQKASDPPATGKIIINPKRWYQLTNATYGLGGLFDGITNRKVETGWGKILENYDSYYPIVEGEQISIEMIKLYDGEGIDETHPMTLYAINSNNEKILMAKFTGKQYNTWVGPDPNNPNNFKLPASLQNIKYLVINSWNFFPAEIELYGTYKAGKPVTAAIKKPVNLRQTFGVNAFEWDFEHPNNPSVIDEERMKVIKNFTGVRHYMDWEKLELKEGSYTFNPVHSGGWNYDAIYERCMAEGILVLACLKTIPGWMQQTYPENQRDLENVPLKYGKDYSDPKSYIEQAKVAFQFAARYGSNKNVNMSLLTVNQTPRWNGDYINTVKIGLDLIKYIECENERDKWWKGRKAYQTAYEYAANLSAFYDGHKNTMGPGVGIKNADPNMKVVMGGLAAANTEYVRGMVEWCRQHRGYNVNGTVNLCWDVINYHLYANDAKTSQGGNATRGAAPEVSEAGQVASDFIQMAHEIANDMPVWVTETGYNVNQGSPFKAISIGGKSVLETQADWILRTALLYARSGIQRVFFYQLYDDNPSNPIQFGSSGLINADKSRKPAADYLYQTAKLFGAYTYKETIHSDPVVDRYELNGQAAFMLVVPDEMGRTASYTLDLGAADSAYIYTPQAGSNNMNVKKVKTSGGKLNLTITETPVFVTPIGTAANNTIVYRSSIEAIDKSEEILLSGTDQVGENNSINLYPNPADQYINLIIRNASNTVIEVSFLELGSGKLYKKFTFKKDTEDFSKKLNIGFLNKGYFLVKITQDGTTTIRKLLKLN